MYERHRSEGFEVLGVCFEKKEEIRKVQKVLEKARAAWPQVVTGTLVRDDPLATKYGFIGVPYTFLLDRDGKLITTQTRDSEVTVKRALSEKSVSK